MSDAGHFIATFLRRLVAVSAPWSLLLISGCSGCTGNYGPSHADRVAATKMDAATIVSNKGGAAVEKHYPPGDAYVVDLTTATFDDELIEGLKGLERVSELNLSGTKITDEQFAKLASAGVLNMTFKLDISKTELTDATLKAITDSKQEMLADLNVKGSKITPAGVSQFTANRPKNRLGLKLKVTQ